MKILLYVQSLSFSKPAIMCARMFAQLTDSPLTLLHVVQRPSITGSLQNSMAHTRGLLPEAQVTTRVRRGSAPVEILAEIKEGDYDLVIVRARKKINFASRWRRTVGRLIAREAPISVLIVKRECPRIEHILICTGGKGISEEVIQTGTRFAQAANAHATLLHVATPLPTMYTGLEKMEETLPELLTTDTPVSQHLREAAEEFAQHQVEADLELRRGTIAEEILREAHRGNYNLIIIGASGTHKGLSKWLLGDVTKEIVDRAACSVLVVRPAARIDKK